LLIQLVRYFLIGEFVELHYTRHMQPGGSEGVTGIFVAGIAMIALGFWFLFDSVQVVHGVHGWLSGMLAMIAAGAGLVLKGYRTDNNNP
jgi:hypothetical protein